MQIHTYCKKRAVAKCKKEKKKWEGKKFACCRQIWPQLAEFHNGLKFFLKSTLIFNYKANLVQDPCVKCEADLRTPFWSRPSSTMEMKRCESKVRRFGGKWVWCPSDNATPL